MPNIVTSDEIRVPLDQDQDEVAAVQAARDAAAAKQDDLDRRQAVLNIQAHRDDRLYQKSIQGHSIAEQNPELASAADWVSQFKSQGPVRAAAAPAATRTRQRGASETRQHQQQQPDLRIRHDVEEIGEGETLVLTLKDRRIGDGDEEDDEDELENLQLVEKRKLEINRDRKAKRRRHDVDEDGEVTARPVLEKYDDIKDELAAKKGGMMITSTGGVVDRAAEIRSKLAMPINSKMVRYDFGSSSSRLQTGDFYTKAEMAASFKKPTIKKKTKTARRTIIAEEMDLPASGPSVDHGSRDTSRASIRARIDASNAEMQKKRERFQIAVAKSDAKSHTLLDQPFVFEDDAEDLQLQEALAQANRAARRAQEQQRRDTTAPFRKATPTPKISSLQPHQQEDEGIVFSTASDFMTNVRANASERAREATAAATEAADAAAKVVVKQEIVIPSDHDDEDDNMEMDDVSPIKTEEPEPESSEDQEELEFMNDVVDNGKGVSAALRLIRSRGMTNAKALPPLIAGRARDAPAPEHKDPAPHLRLDHVDDFGRPMTMKESFRELSYRFHGHRPGAKKREKMLKELQQQLKLQESISGRSATSTQRLADVSAKAGRHYVVMDSKTGAFGKVATQKLAIGTEDDDLGVVQAADLDDRAYVAGSKKVEFAIGKSE